MNSSIQIYSISQFSLFYKPIICDCYLGIVITDSPRKLIYGEEYLEIEYSEKMEDQINQYLKTIQFIQERLPNSSIQINQTQNGFSEAILCALLMEKGQSLRNCKMALQILDIQLPPEQYFQSLMQFESILMEQSNSQLLSSFNLQQSELVLSQYISAPVFNFRLIEQQIFSNVLEPEVQVESAPLAD